MQSVDLDDQKIQFGQISVHERVEFLRGEGHEAPRRCGFRYAAAMPGRHIALRQANRTAEAPRRDVDQHQVHRPTTEPVLRCRTIPARERHLTTIDATDPRALDADLPAVEPDCATGRSPAIGRALLHPLVTRTAGRFNVGLHHGAQRLDAGGKTKSLEALLNFRQGFIHSSGNRSRRQCAIFLHGVALLKGFDTPSLTAQGGQRRHLQNSTATGTSPQNPMAPSPTAISGGTLMPRALMSTNSSRQLCVLSRTPTWKPTSSFFPSGVAPRMTSMHSAWASIRACR